MLAFWRNFLIFFRDAMCSNVKPLYNWLAGVSETTKMSIGILCPAEILFRSVRNIWLNMGVILVYGVNFKFANFYQEKLGRFPTSCFSRLLHTARKSSCFPPTEQANLTHLSCATLWTRVRSRSVFVHREFIDNPLFWCLYIVQLTVKDLCTFSEFTVLSNSEAVLICWTERV